VFVTINYPKIFIVDDDLSFGKSLKRLLDASGYSSAYLESAKSFLDLVPFAESGIVVLDIHMPNMDGFELMATMRERGYKMPVIFISGQMQDELKNLALSKGAVGFVQKLCCAGTLLEMLRRLIPQNADEAY
jgi:FixJ family two-component response regulator